MSAASSISASMNGAMNSGNTATWRHTLAASNFNLVDAKDLYEILYRYLRVRLRAHGEVRGVQETTSSYRRRTHDPGNHSFERTTTPRDDRPGAEAPGAIPAG